MKFSIVNFLFVFALSSAYSQNTINFSKCGHVSFCMDCGITKARFKDSLTIDRYFIKQMNPESIRSIKGQLIVEVLILTDGRSCCRSITNESSFSKKEVQKLKIDAIIDGMPGWTIATDEKGGKQNSVVFLLLKFDKGRLTVEYKTMEIIGG